MPEPPKKDLMKMLENDHKELRYAARMVRDQPELERDREEKRERNRDEV